MCIFHYTTIDAIPGICQSNGLSFWATRYNYLNDPLEFVLYEKQKSLIEKLCNEKKWAYDKDMTLSPYIISFCAKEDDFNMWRLYGDNGYGTMLILDDDVMEKTSLLIKEDIFNGKTLSSRCNIDYLLNVLYYDKGNQIEQFCKCFNALSEKYPTDFQDQALTACCFLKSIDYEIETEVRYIRVNYNGLIATSAEDIREIPEMSTSIKYRVRKGGIIVPYIEIVFPKEALLGMILGYNSEIKNVDTLCTLLQSRGYKGQTIRMSDYSMLNNKPLVVV